MAVLGLRFCARAFFQLWQAGATLHRGARASHYHGLSCCGAQAPDAQAQQLWLTGLIAPWHVGSSQTRAQTHVSCIGRQILNHCTTREALRNFQNLKKKGKWRELGKFQFCCIFPIFYVYFFFKQDLYFLPFLNFFSYSGFFSLNYSLGD